MEMCLDHLRLGKRAVVTDIATDAALRERLHTFGFVPGTQVLCSYRCPGGSVTALEFRGTTVALRTRDMHGIRVQCG